MHPAHRAGSRVAVVERARGRLAKKNAESVAPGGGRHLTTTIWSVGVTVAKLVHKQYGVTEHLWPKLAGCKVAPIESAVGVLSVGSLGAMRRIGRHFKDLRAGERVSIELLERGSVRLEGLTCNEAEGAATA